MIFSLKSTALITDRLPMSRISTTLISLLILSFVLASCGPVDQKMKDELVLRQKLGASSYVSDDEFYTAQSLCDLFRLKRSNFFLERINQNFDFRYDYKKCEGTRDSGEFSATLKDTSDGNLYFSVTSDLPFYRKVETHQDGELKSFCDEVFQNNKFLNTIERGDYQYQYKFHNSPFGFTKYSAKKSDGLIYKVEKFSVYKKPTNEKDKGIVYQYSFDQTCSKESQKEVYSQELVE